MTRTVILALVLAVTAPASTAAAQKRTPRAKAAGAARAGKTPGKAVAAGGKAAVVETGDDASVDWTRGLVIGTGAAAADMRAPSAEIARVRAERQARERALAAARSRLDALPFEGRPLGKHEDLRPVIGEAVDQRARDLDVRYGSDGSAQVTVAIPLEAIRAAAVASRTATIAGEPSTDGPTAVVIDARRLRGRVTPVLGLQVKAGETEFSGPTVYIGDLGAARADPRLGPRPIEFRAKRYSRGVLTLEGGERLDKLAAARQPLVVVVIKARRGKGRSR